MEDNNVNNAASLLFFLFMFVSAVVMFLMFGTQLLSFNAETRKQTRQGNITTEEYASTQTDYESYLGEYDGTYTLAEVLGAVENNHDKYNIFICTDSTRVELHSRTYEGYSLADYLQQGYIKEVKDIVYGGYTDSNAKFLCYLDVSNKGEINNIYYYRKAK